MSEKEKGKHNPFIAVLRPDEEILWFYASSTAWESVEMLKRAVRIVMTFLFCFSLMIVAAFLVQALVLHDDILLTISVGMGVFIAFYSFVMLYPFSLLRASPSYVYAVTNTRLLSGVRGKVTSLDLEEINTFYISSPEEGHLFFSLSMPEWRNIPDPEEVLEIVAQAKEKRTQRLDMERETDEDDRKSEGQIEFAHLKPLSLTK